MMGVIKKLKYFDLIMVHSRSWKEAHFRSCLCLLLHKVASIEYTDCCAYNKHNTRVPADLDIRAIGTRTLSWSSIYCGQTWKMKGWGNIEMGVERSRWTKGRIKVLLMAGLKRRLDFLLNMVLKPTAPNMYPPSIWPDCLCIQSSGKTLHLCWV